MSTQSQHGVTVQQCPCGGQRTLFCVLDFFCCESEENYYDDYMQRGNEACTFPR